MSNDFKPPPGFQYVRIDGYGTETPYRDRVYVKVPTGYGEGARAMKARSGLPNFRKIWNRARTQAKTGRRPTVVLPPISRDLRELIRHQQKAAKAAAGGQP